MKKYYSHTSKKIDSENESQITFLLHNTLDKSFSYPFFKKLLFIYQIEHDDYNRIDIEIYSYEYIIMNIHFRNNSKTEFIYYMFDNELFDSEFQRKAIQYKWQKETQKRLFYIHIIFSIFLFYKYSFHIFTLFSFFICNTFLFLFF